MINDFNFLPSIDISLMDRSKEALIKLKNNEHIDIFSEENLNEESFDKLKLDMQKLS